MITDKGLAVNSPDYNAVMDASAPTPEGYERYVITHVEKHGDGLMIKYGGRVFCGVMLDELTPEIVGHIRAGTEVIVRRHSAETGYDGTIAHMLIAHPSDEGWAEIYADY